MPAEPTETPEQAAERMVLRSETPGGAHAIAVGPIGLAAFKTSAYSTAFSVRLERALAAALRERDEQWRATKG